jgi:hypothetical protein
LHGVTRMESPRSVRQGKPWSDEENCRLLGSIQSKKTVKEIATAHQRSVSAITSRLRYLSVKFHREDNLTNEEIQVITGLSIEKIEDAIRRAPRERRVKNYQSAGERRKKIEVMISDIQQKLDILKRELESIQ